MKPETRSQNIKVGVFLAVGIAAFMISVLLLGGNRVVFVRYNHYSTDFTEVQGLFVGSVVSLQGLPVGNVEAIEFAPGSQKIKVRFAVERKFAERIYTSSTAEIRTQGALGDKYIYVEGTGPQPSMADGGILAAVETGDFLKMVNDKEQGVSKVFALISELHALVASLNANGRMGLMVENMGQAAGQMKQTIAQLDLLLGDLRGEIPNNKKLRQAVTDLASILEKIDQGKGTLGALVNDPSLHQNLKALLGSSPRHNYLKNVMQETIQQGQPEKQ